MTRAEGFGPEVCRSCGSRDGASSDEAGTTYCREHVCWPCANGLHRDCVGVIGREDDYGTLVHCRCDAVVSGTDTFGRATYAPSGSNGPESSTSSRGGE